MTEYPILRPPPWKATPYGPYRWLQDGRLEKFRTDGVRVIRWIETNCVFTKDRWRGRPFKLLPWQKQLIIDLFEMVPDGKGGWRRRYRTALIGVPKKQGKTELVGALADYFLLGAGEPDPKIICAAAADTQADLVFGVAKAMIELSPSLSRQVNSFQREIQVRGNTGEWIRRVPANGGKFDGQNLLMAAADEIHEWLSFNQRKMHGMISGAFATRLEPMHVMITTAGADEPDADDDEVPPWLRMYRYGRRVEAGEVEDRSFFFRWWQAPEGVDYRDPAAWADPGVNPSYGVTVGPEFYRSELGKRTESEFRRYYLNQLQDELTTWVEGQTWDACAVGAVEFDRSAPVWAGWDASTRRDSTALVAVQWGEVAGERRLLAKHWVWERPIGSDGPDESWRVPVAEVKAVIAELFAAYQVRGLAYDPAFVTWSADDLESRGLPLIEWPQTDERMVPATQALLELLIDVQLAHSGDPVFRRHILSAKAKAVPRGGIRLRKAAVGKKMDLAIALVMAVGALRKAEEAAVPAYYSFSEGGPDEGE